MTFSLIYASIFKLYVSFNTVATECAGILKNKLNQKMAANKHVDVSNPDNFLEGIIYLNPLLNSEVERRMPGYSFGRFGNGRDVKKAFPDFEMSQTMNFLKTPLCPSLLKKFKPIKGSKISKLMKETESRILEIGEKPSKSDLHHCTPWLSKNKPLSSVESLKSPLKGKIYISISLRHSAENDKVIVQETETCIGYMPPVFSAHATVAFPPICKGEVWTIGWIQAVTKFELDTYCGMEEL